MQAFFDNGDDFFPFAPGLKFGRQPAQPMTIRTVVDITFPCQLSGCGHVPPAYHLQKMLHFLHGRKLKLHPQDIYKQDRKTLARQSIRQTRLELGRIRPYLIIHLTVNPKAQRAGQIFRAVFNSPFLHLFRTLNKKDIFPVQLEFNL